MHLVNHCSSAQFPLTKRAACGARHLAFIIQT